MHPADVVDAVGHQFIEMRKRLRPSVRRHAVSGDLCLPRRNVRLPGSIDACGCLRQLPILPATGPSGVRALRLPVLGELVKSTPSGARFPRTSPFGLVAIGSLVACGARTGLDILDDVPEASLTDSVQPFVDAPLITEPVEASTACTPNGGGGGGGNGDCMTWLDETCDGIDFQVSCDCPTGNCVCFGPSTKVVQLPSCTGCPNVTEAFALCGFPPYPGPSIGACTSASMCSKGDICCGDLEMSTSCLPGPCPLATFPIQLCATSAECFTQGDTCGPLTTPVAVSGITVCNASSGGGAASGSPSSSP